MERTVTIELGENKLEVTGYYQPMEKMVRYYSDGSGYPGCAEEFEPDKIMLGKENITDLVDELGAIDRVIELCFEKMRKEAEL